MIQAEEYKMVANAYEETGDYENALRLYRLALLVKETAVGKDSAELAPFIYELAMIHAALDHHTEARNLLMWLCQVTPAEHALAGEVELILSELKEATAA